MVVDYSTLKIAVGTTSEQKIGYLREVLDEIKIKAKIFSVDVKSGVGAQPTTEEETQEGSINRAKGAFVQAPKVDFGIGIEVGYDKQSLSRRDENKSKDYEMFCCTSIVDKNGFVQTCTSSRFLLPDFHQQILKENKNLGEFVSDYKKEIDEPVTNYVRELVRGRKPLIIEATRNAILTYMTSKI